MRKIPSAFLLLTAVCAHSAYAEGLYGSIKIQSAQQNLSSALLTSPRVDNRVVNPDTNKEFTGSLALGYAFTGGWRVEGEYSIKNDSEFKSYWSPFNANVNNMQVSSERLMVNGYKDFALTEWLSVYGMAGVGLAHINSEGYQSTPSRRFAGNAQNNFTYSLGLGADVKLNEKITLGTGYRFVNMGDIETGYNTFANRINARDEQLKGKLKEQNLFVEARMSF
jgi:opacity protein-like surface antigen